MGAVVQGAADRVQGVRQHGVVLREGDGEHTGGIEIVVGLGGAVEEADVARTDHATLESAAFGQVLDRYEVHRIAVAGEAI